MPGPGGFHGGPGGPGRGHGGPGGPGDFGGGRPRMGGGFGHGGWGHRPPPPPRRGGGCCGCLFPVIGVVAVAVFGLLALIF